MTLQGRTIRGLFAGAIGGLVAWLLIERSGSFDRLLYNTGGLVPGSHLYWLEAALGGLYGLIVAVAIGAVDWNLDPAKPKEARAQALVLSGLAGLVGGAVGMQVGQWVYSLLLTPSNVTDPNQIESQLIAGMVARCAGWAIVGFAIGVAQGVARGSWRVSRLGGLGGLLGGIAGGGIFEALEIAASNPPMARLAGFVIVGSATGFFLEFVPFLMKQAWVRLENGRGAGGEFLLEKVVTTVGRSELADISLYGDPSIAPIQCTIERRQAEYLLYPAGRDDPASRAVAKQSIPIEIDGEPLAREHVLSDGASIKIGDRLLQFRVRTASRGTVRPRQTPPVQPPTTPSTTARPVERVPAVAMAVDGAPLKPEEVGHIATARRIAADGLSGSKLVCVHGPYFGQTFALASRGKVVIGRAPDCDIALTSDKTISRHHVAVHLDYGRHRAEDLRSANRTYINDNRLPPAKPTELKPGDVIRLGETSLKYE